GQLASLDRLLIQTEELFEGDCGAPTVEEDVMEAPDHSQPVLTKRDGGHAHQRRGLKVQALPPVVLQQRLQSGLVRIWIQPAPVQVPQLEWRLRLDRLHWFPQ